MASISIIVPVYNCEVYLQKCLDSILSQATRSIELILIDDGSTDGSGIICDNLPTKDSRIKVLHQDNKGPSAARNLGIAEASCEYIIFVDSDDYLQPNALEKMLSSISSYQSDLIFYGYSKVNNLGHALFELGPIFNGTISKHDFINDANYYLNNMYYHVIFNKIYKREIIKQHNICFDENTLIGEDLLFNLHYFSCSSMFSFVSTCLYNHRIDNKNSIMNNLYKTTCIPNINHFLIEFKSIDLFFNNNNRNSDNGFSESVDRYYVQTIDSLINNLVKNKVKHLKSTIRSFLKECKSIISITKFSYVKFPKTFHFGWLLSDPVLLIVRSKIILLRYHIIMKIRKEHD